jgi:AraC family transcriptional regulator of adaptative response / DNA-3-methyladenine glycosylase II
VELSHTICRSARLARDPRFDGKFFIGVRTTGIYCRPICPAPSPKEQNVSYYPSAAAASEAGLRPCLRCRPECSPGTPAWLGSPVTVSRALRLISEGAMEDAGVDALAERLGIGARHLRRLFLEHLGATPVAVAQTRRLLAAKKLIDETALPLTEIAIVSGFGSIRRFNAAFRATWDRSPRELRRGRGAIASRGGPCVLELRYRPPFDWAALVGFLAGRAIGGVEHVESDLYRRTIITSRGPGWIEVRPAGKNALKLTVHCPDASDLLTIATKVRRLFDLDADPQTIARHLRQDPLLAPLVKARPGLRVPGAWDGFEIGVRAILGQQVSVAGASTLAGRLVQEFGQPVPFEVEGLTHTFPSPATLAKADISGMPAARAEAIRQFARAVASGEVAFDAAVDSEAFQQKLCSLPGIGPWTAQYVAMRALSDPDAFPASDLVLRRACGNNETASWRPWRAYAAMHIWQGVRDGTIDGLHMDGKSRRKAVAGGG